MLLKSLWQIHNKGAWPKPTFGSVMNNCSRTCLCTGNALAFVITRPSRSEIFISVWVTCFVALDFGLKIIYYLLESFWIYEHQGLCTCRFPQSQSWCRFLWSLTITWPWLSILVTAFLHPSIHFLLKISRYFNLLNAAVSCFVCRHIESSCFLMMRDGFID